MKNNFRIGAGKIAGEHFLLRVAAGVAISVAVTLPALAAVDGIDRSGKEVVQATCVACHATGKDGAPRIGDKEAWSQRSARGLTSLTQSALAGIRKMPAHGGSADASDVEISRAITYMVNQSGGKWIEPIGRAAPAVKPAPTPERSGQYIVQTQCGKCHLTGENGAPKIDDRDAWIQRLKRGMDEVVRSAFNGHGPMPARGGVGDITDKEMRNAIGYMLNPASATVVPTASVPKEPETPFHKTVGNTEIFFGIASTESIRAAQKNRVATIADVPDGAGYYHVNVTLRDRTSKAAVVNARVEARVEDPVMRSESKSLGVIAVASDKATSYGNFFRLPTKGRYLITVTVQRPSTPAPVEARFEFNRD